MTENITLSLNRELELLSGLQDAFSLLNESQLFGRETKSAALGEISEHLVARFVNGRRCKSGNKGFDVISDTGTKIEVKSRLPGEWGDSLQFNFRKHTEGADEVFCVCWKIEGSKFSIGEAYRFKVVEALKLWGTPNQKRYFARTDLKKLRKACG